MLDWDRAQQAGPTVVGGKGWNLGRLHRYGFPVPRGGVLPAEAYTRFMSQGDIPALLKELEGVAAEEVTERAVVDDLAALREAICAASLPPDAVDAVRAFLSENALEHVPLAVRSSATAEDGATASFAGIHRSFLGIEGPEAVLDAIRGCYASLWTPQAVGYRRRMGLSDLDVSCAVVLCEMVGEGGDPRRDPVAAGVAFSCDPRTGRVDVVTISAGQGLGDAVVSGKTDPEEITIAQWGEAGQARIIERVSPRGPVLSDDTALALAHMVLRVHWALGDGQDPQDVEWAYDGSRLWLLQARPVTSPLQRLPEGAEHLPVIWSNANLKDGMPGVLTPMTSSLLLPGMREHLYTAMRFGGYPVTAGMESVRRFSGRAYFNLTAMSWLFYDAFGMLPAALNRVLGGHQPEIPVPSGDPLRSREGRRRRTAGFKLLMAAWNLRRGLPREVDRIHEHTRAERMRDLSALSLNELYELSTRQGKKRAEFTPRFMLSAIGVWQDILEHVVRRIHPGNASSLAAGLMAGAGGVVSAEHAYRLHDIACSVADDAEATRYLEAEPLDPWGWRGLPDESTFRREMERFLDDFGHRTVYEAEIANPRWHEDPSFLLEQVRLLRIHNGTEGSPREMGRSKHAAALVEMSQRSFFWRPVIRWLVRRAQHASALREAAKSAIVALLEPTRRLHLEVGRRMYTADLLDGPEDVVYLTNLDVEAYLRGWWGGTGAREMVTDRKLERERCLAEASPDVLVMDGQGRAVPCSSDKRIAPKGAGTAQTPAVDGVELGGVAVASGRASGLARVLMHPNEGGRLQPGEVLVAPSTDPGWTPLFLRAAALVLEHGGYLSHGAIVAREFGIPAVSNVQGVVDAVTDGESLFVDGDAGRVTRVSSGGTAGTSH